MDVDKKRVEYYKIGEMVAEIWLRGIIHKDMQMANIGLRNGKEPVFCDFADITKFDMPKDLDEKIVRNLTESLFPLLDDINNSFSYCSSFRAGLVAKAGLLGHEIFKNAINNGFSSDLFEKHPGKSRKYDVSKLYYECKEIILEWKMIDLDSINMLNFSELEQYEAASIRKAISERNLYYLDMLYLTRTSWVTVLSDELKMPLACLCLNMAAKAMKNNMPYTEYGLIMKCLKLKSENKQIEEIAKQRSFQILFKGNLNSKSIDYILMCTEKYDLFELLWILEDEDTFNKFDT